MKLAISNIAWNAGEAEAAYRILADHGVRGIEVAPGILFPDCPTPLDPPPAAIRAAIRRAESFGLCFASMQSVHFGLADAALFGTAEQSARFVAALRQAIGLAAALAIPNIVLGSPRNRVRPDALEPDRALAIAAETLAPLGDAARRRGVTIAIEANPARYGTNFVTHFDEAVALCRRIGDPAFGVNYDLGERLINGRADQIASDIAGAGTMIAHVQVSAPDLAPPLESLGRLPGLFAALRKGAYGRWTSVEMRRSPERALCALETVAREVTRLAGLTPS
jgi:sugar phosphate isomerase/epimerase